MSAVLGRPLCTSLNWPRSRVLFDADAFPGECFRERGIGALREGGVGGDGDAADFLWLLHIVWLYYI